MLALAYRNRGKPKKLSASTKKSYSDFKLACTEDITQGDSGGKGNILGDDIVGRCDKEGSYEHVFNC